MPDLTPQELTHIPCSERAYIACIPPASNTGLWAPFEGNWLTIFQFMLLLSVQSDDFSYSIVVLENVLGRVFGFLAHLQSENSLQKPL